VKRTHVCRRVAGGALPISGFVPAGALEDSAPVSPGLLTALLRIPCKVSRGPYDGLCNVE